MGNNEIVVLKGYPGGINMIVDSSADINLIMSAIREKIKSAGSFFKGECDIRVSGREFSKSDELRIRSVMNTIYPEANILFAEPEALKKSEPEVVAQNHTQMGAWFMEELEKAAKQSRAMLKTDKTEYIKPQKMDVRLYCGNISCGETLRTPGDLLVVGNVSAGGTVCADGSVYIMGKLEGIAIAGAAGDENSRIYATGFNPETVKIADVGVEFDKIAQETSPKMAYLIKRVVLVEKIL